MVVKRFLALALAGLLFAPPMAFGRASQQVARAAMAPAVLTAIVTTTSAVPLTQLELGLVNLDNGKVTLAQTDATGTFRQTLEPGRYTVDAGRSGYRIVRGPSVVSIASGQPETAEIVLELRDQEAAPLLPPARGQGFFGSTGGIITLSALGLSSVAAVVILTRDKDNKGKPPVSTSTR